MPLPRLTPTTRYSPTPTSVRKAGGGSGESDGGVGASDVLMELRAPHMQQSGGPRKMRRTATAGVPQDMKNAMAADTVVGLQVSANLVPEPRAPALACLPHPVAVTLLLHLQMVDFSNNRIGRTASLELASWIRDTSTVHTLILAETQLSDSHAATIAVALQVRGSTGTPFAMPCSVPLLASVRTHSPGARNRQRHDRVTTLDLSSNSIGASGAAAIGRLLAASTALRTMNLRWNKLRQAGGVHIGTALLTNRSLTVSDHWYCMCVKRVGSS